jgi:putative heme-binding domain-containing protein
MSAGRDDRQPHGLQIRAPLLWLAALALIRSIHAAEPDRDDPAAELASFKLPLGFEANLFASEKDGVAKPIQIRWDTRGRLWVIQSTTYPQLVPGEEPNDKVLILEDTDGDGRADKTTVFADGLMIPTGLEIAPVGSVISHQSSVNGGRADAPSPPITDHRSPITFPSAAYIGEGTKLWLMTDTDGDGKADKKEVVLRGFGTGDNHQNINSFRWSPGGELFFSQGLHAHARIETPHGIVPLDEAGFWRFRPREQRLDSFYGGPAEPQNPWGFVWTDWGQMLMVAGNNGGVYWPLPEMIRGVRYGKRDQIWVNARGRKCSGPDIVGTAHLPPEWQGRFISGGYINNAVWTMAIEDDGAGFKLTDREPLITSTHGSFRPVDVKIGPDGAIYICDWYNPIIGHYQASFRHPDRDKAHGRIWRVTYKDRPLVKPPKIAGASLEELFENLKSGERWVREQTRREIASRPQSAAWKLRDIWGSHFDPAAPENDRIAMEMSWVFETHGVLDPLPYELAASQNPDVRARAAEISQRLLENFGSDLRDEWRTLVDLAGNRHPRVRTGAVVAAGNIRSDGSLAIVVRAANPFGDKFLDLAARSAVASLTTAEKPLNGEDASGWDPEWRERLDELRRPPGSPKLAKPSVVKITPIVTATGKLRATPEFVAGLMREVRENGDAKHGAEVFRRAELACTACHSIADQGGKIGPPLDTIGSGQPLDFIMGATLEPQREIKESYEAMQLTAKDGRTAIGYIAARDPSGTTIRDPATGAETKFAAADIAEQKQLGSFMPAGLVDNLPRADLRDLFRYLSELGKPKP